MKVLNLYLLLAHLSLLVVADNVHEVSSVSTSPRYTFYKSNIDSLSAHTGNCTVAYNKLIAFTCGPGWTFLATMRSFYAVANQPTSHFKADVTKLYSQNSGPRTIGNIISFVSDNKLILQTWSDYF